jgi:adenylylsulfate kinase
MIVIMVGLPGAGKSFLARALAKKFSGAVIDKDVVRAALFPPDEIEYSAGQDDFCLSVMLSTARYLLEKNPVRLVFIDGRTFSRTYQIDAVVRYAEGIPTPWRIIECVCAEEIARARLERDAREGRHPARNRDWALYRAVRDSFEPVARPRVLIDTGRPLEECVGQAISGLEIGRSTSAVRRRTGSPRRAP